MADEEAKHSSTDEQEIRSFLRERFLKSIQTMYNKPAVFTMHERTEVRAVFRGTDINIENFAVSELKSPIGLIPEAILRASDVLCFTVKDDVI
ncbi:predicted protein [Nematostella vectensis]|uniref:Gem-associated protein 7 n=1 Tax=Nematostella vectensis TaxID=45351 RepID=A7S0B3_NEMVE|nr:predicted protein [Nematostella vectensis]|eukprot:XP_001634868.1 predicted protein [Nematostella vectensis]